MKLILSRKDLSRLSAPTRAEILGYVGSRAPAADYQDQEYIGFDMSNVADLSHRQMQTWMKAASNWTKAGLRAFAEQGAIIHIDTLVDALKKEGSENYSQFQSRTTIRTRTVTGNKEAFLLGWDDWDEDGGRYAVSPQTYKSLRRYFRLDEEKTS